MKHPRKIQRALIATALAICVTGTAGAAGLDQPAEIVFDRYDVPTVKAKTEHDAIYLQGYLHAKDRFFQMDYQRRLFSGRLSELVGPAAIPTDVQLRTLGLRRAAERSLAVQTPEVMAWLEAYADGVNAFIHNRFEILPPEYAGLELDRDGIPPWTPLDSLTMAKGLAFGLSFDLSDIDRTLALLNFLGSCNFIGCQGLQLFQADLYRTAPFEAQRSIPPPPPPSGAGPENSDPPADEEHPDYLSDPNFETLVQEWRDEIADIPILESALEQDLTSRGSNWWVVSGQHTESGFPMLANDPHLALGTPATFYEIHLNVENGINVTGVSFPGAPGIVQGCNDTICWGSSVNSIDVTDVYNEVLQALDPSQPTTPTHTTFQGAPEPLQFIPQIFMFNNIGDGVNNTLFDAGVPADQGGVTLVVPRRNNGPIVSVNFDPSSPTPLTGISVQYVGWSATQELEAFRQFTRAGSMQDFKDALQFFDVGSQNWGYADINGNIAYYTSGELPIREDLQFLFFPDGLINPALIRDGTNTSKHEWLPVLTPQPNQSLNHEILPFVEMPQTENPSAGYILNANNDPIGTTFDNVSWNQFRRFFNGRLYLSSGYATGYRMGRIQRIFDGLLAGGGKVSDAESIDAQGNNQLLDAEVMAPFLLSAYDNATEPGAPPELTDIVADERVGEAIGRIAGWDFSTPTGIDEGWDPGDAPGVPGPAGAADIDASVAATIYAAWRSKLVQRVVDQTLANQVIPLDAFAPPSAQAMAAVREFLEDYPTKGGTGTGLINFFEVPGVSDQDVARDIILLESLQQGLDLLASDEFAPAFGNSTDQGDYRWGKLHRIVLAHPLGGSLNIPPPGSPDNLSASLPGFSRAGGMGAVDASSHSARADGLNEFMFNSGPARRVIATLKPSGPDVQQVIPGGQSGVPTSPFQTDQLVLWLVNAYHPLPIILADVDALAVKVAKISCGNGVMDMGEQCDDGNAEDNDGCNSGCRSVGIITCLNPVVAADASSCTAEPACSAVASCVHPDGSVVTLGCDSGGPQGLGATDVPVQCADISGDTNSRTCGATIADMTPPTLEVETPAQLWPPNHRLIDVSANLTASDACGATDVVLASLTSNEPDDQSGNDDGETLDDIRLADLGTPDTEFQLRAERTTDGAGREYTVTYTATDGSGNETIVVNTIAAPHDQQGVVEPLEIMMDENGVGTVASWNAVDGATSYNVIRTTLSEISTQGDRYDLGTVTCVESGSVDLDTVGNEEAAIPAPGEVFLFMVEYDDGESSGHGTVTSAKSRKPSGGNCQ